MFGDVLFAEQARRNLGTLAALVGDLDEARDWLEAARDSARARGDVAAERRHTTQLSDIARAAGDVVSSAARQAEVQDLLALGA